MAEAVGLHRRSFLKLLSSGLVAISLPPVEWMPGVATAPVAIDLSAMGGITAEVLRLMTANMVGVRARFVPEAAGARAAADAVERGAIEFYMCSFVNLS